MDDGLMQLPSSYDVSNPDHHAQLARETGFRACVLRSCASLLEDAQAAAASALLLQEGEGREGEGAGAPAAAEVLELGPALFKVTKVGCDGNGLTGCVALARKQQCQAQEDNARGASQHMTSGITAASGVVIVF
jgi:hypothetical protein